MVRKGLVSFYKLRVLDHFGKKGARRRDQPYGGRFFGRWRSSDLRSAKKATPYSLCSASCAVITVTKNAVITVTSGHDDVGSKETNMSITSNGGLE